jgi:cell wall-associated NlpC family hydrolase
LPHITSTRPAGRHLVAAALTALLMLGSLVLVDRAAASGGVSAGGTEPGKIEKARLVDGKAIPPKSAPRKIKRVIRAANEIRRKPYKWGGGHARWNDSGYDCSGAVSYALRGGRMLSQPLNSSGLARWGRKGKGKWLTVFGARSHAYMVVAGLRFDTSGTGGKGPRWSKKLRSTSENYNKRRWRNL